ncbi:MAG: hypothetical protein R6X34_16160 [Chloroflexota bacterium]
MSINLLSVALQSSPTDYLLLLLFAILAVIFLSVFFSWFRAVSEIDLGKIIASDARQTTGLALTGEIPPEHAEAEAEAIADRTILLAAMPDSEPDEIHLPAKVEETLTEETVEMVEAEITEELASTAADTEEETAVSSPSGL